MPSKTDKKITTLLYRMLDDIAEIERLLTTKVDKPVAAPERPFVLPKPIPASNLLLRRSPKQKYCSAKAVADHFGISIATLRRWLRERRLQLERTLVIHNRYFFDIDEVLMAR